MAYDVHLVNPSSPKKRKTMAKKRSSKRRAPARRRRAPAAPAAHAPKRRRRRRNPNPGKKLHRRRRRNPSMRGLAGGLMGQIKTAMPRMVGQMAVSAAAKFAERFGGKSAGGSFSVTYGEPWTWQQYAAALGVALLAPKFVGRWVNPAAFTTGAVDLIVGKALYTEAIARVPAAQKFLGEAGDYEVQYDPRNGQGYVNVDGNFEAMQGLVERSALDGLVDAPPYGELVPAGPLGTADYRANRNSSEYSY